MVKFTTFSVALTAVALSGCASFGPKDQPMASKLGVVPGATSQELLRSPQVSSVEKEYVVGADNLPSNVIIKTSGSGSDLNFFLSAVQVTVPSTDEASAQMAADLSDNLGLPARVEGDVIVMDGIPNSAPTLGFGNTEVSPAQVNDCYLKLGSCKTVLVKADGTKVPVVVETGNQLGLWYQTVRTDPKFVLRRSTVISKTVFSVDGSGALRDMNTVSYLDRNPVKKYVRRVQ